MLGPDAHRCITALESGTSGPEPSLLQKYLIPGIAEHHVPHTIGFLLLFLNILQKFNTLRHFENNEPDPDSRFLQ